MAISSKMTNVGLGSGAFNRDMLDQLRKVDEKSQIDPIRSNIEKNALKQKELTSITTILTKIKASTKDLSNENSYLKREITASGDSATATVRAGVNLQSFSIDVQKIAQKDSYQTPNFKYRGDILGLSKDTKLRIKIDGQKYDIDLRKKASYEELVDKINDSTQGDVIARVVNVGGDKPYQLVISSKKTGEDQKIEFEEIEEVEGPDGKKEEVAKTSGELLNKLGLDSDHIAENRLTKAQNAQFSYDGLNIIRPTNTFSDLRPGIDITLKETGKTNFSVTQNAKDIKNNISEMVSAYNELINTLNVVTDYDQDTKTSGIFQGVSEITNIRQDLSNILIAQDSKGRDLQQYGVVVNENGLLEFKESEFDAKFSNNADDIKDFFFGASNNKRIQFNAGEINSGELEVSNNALQINGISITLPKTSSSNTASQNAQALARAINNANIDGLMVTLDSNGEKLILSRKDGFDIDIDGNKDILEKLGFKKTTISAVSDYTEGVFAKFNKKVEDLLDRDKGGTLSLYDTRLKDQKKKLIEEQAKTQESINKKFEIMTERFIKYDQVITKLQNQFAPLKSMIDFELSKK